MKRLGYGLTLLLLTTAFSVAEMRTWTSTAGTTLEAELVKEKLGVAHLKVADGSIKKIKLAHLSKADRQFVETATDPFAAKKAAKKAAEQAKRSASPELIELLGKSLRTAEDKKVPTDDLVGKTIGLYFSASWCPPCRAFTPVLVEFHNEMKEEGNPFEIIFVSGDRDKGSMFNYMENYEMPWLALAFGDEHNDLLSAKFGVSGIPALIIINEKGELITKNGRGDVSQYGAEAFKKWE